MSDGLLPQWPHSRPCKIAWVAEAPGDEEIAGNKKHPDGAPLIGPSGHNFDTALRMAGINRSAGLVTNVFNVQLPDNDVFNWCLDTKSMEVQKKEERYDLPAIARGKWLDMKYAGHLDRLKEEIEACEPNLIVALGGTALWAFTGFSNIKQRRGAICEATMTCPGVKVLPAPHPAAMLYDYSVLHVLVKDFLKAKRECEFPDIRYTPRKIFVAESGKDINLFALAHLHDAEWISIDIETYPTMKQITCISFSPDEKIALVIPFVDLRKPDRSYWKTAEEEVEAWQYVRAICALPNPKLGQNFDYDFKWLYDMGIPVRNALHDTRLMHHALYPELPKDLGFLGSIYAQSEAAWKTYRPMKSEKREE